MIYVTYIYCIFIFFVLFCFSEMIDKLFMNFENKKKKIQFRRRKDINYL